MVGGLVARGVAGPVPRAVLVAFGAGLLVVSGFATWLSGGRAYSGIGLANRLLGLGDRIDALPGRWIAALLYAVPLAGVAACFLTAAGSGRASRLAVAALGLAAGLATLVAGLAFGRMEGRGPGVGLLLAAGGAVLLVAGAIIQPKPLGAGGR